MNWRFIIELLLFMLASMGFGFFLRDIFNIRGGLKTAKVAVLKNGQETRLPFGDYEVYRSDGDTFKTKSSKTFHVAKNDNMKWIVFIRL